MNESRNKVLPLLKNAAAAERLYFDMAPCYGCNNGVVELVLADRVLQPKPDGSVQIDMVAVAHLRCSIAAALNLREALDKAIAMSGATIAPAAMIDGASAAPPPKH